MKMWSKNKPETPDPNHAEPISHVKILPNSPKPFNQDAPENQIPNSRRLTTPPSEPVEVLGGNVIDINARLAERTANEEANANSFLRRIGKKFVNFAKPFSALDETELSELDDKVN